MFWPRELWSPPTQPPDDDQWRWWSTPVNRCPPVSANCLHHRQFQCLSVLETERRGRSRTLRTLSNDSTVACYIPGRGVFDQLPWPKWRTMITVSLLFCWLNLWRNCLVFRVCRRRRLSVSLFWIIALVKSPQVENFTHLLKSVIGWFKLIWHDFDNQPWIIELSTERF